MTVSRGCLEVEKSHAAGCSGFSEGFQGCLTHSTKHPQLMFTAFFMIFKGITRALCARQPSVCAFVCVYVYLYVCCTCQCVSCKFTPVALRNSLPGYCNESLADRHLARTTHTHKHINPRSKYKTQRA